jgi:hypothetical protein
MVCSFKSLLSTSSALSKSFLVLRGLPPEFIGTFGSINYEYYRSRCIISIYPISVVDDTNEVIR